MFEDRQKFDGIAQVGITVHYYPYGKVDANTIPRVGFIQRGWQKGVANIALLPQQDGAVEVADCAMHISDPRALTVGGILSNAAMQRGLWDFLPGQAPVEQEPEQKPKKVAAK